MMYSYAKWLYPLSFCTLMIQNWFETFNHSCLEIKINKANPNLPVHYLFVCEQVEKVTNGDIGDWHGYTTSKTKKTYP